MPFRIESVIYLCSFDVGSAKRAWDVRVVGNLTSDSQICVSIPFFEPGTVIRVEANHVLHAPLLPIFCWTCKPLPRTPTMLERGCHLVSSLGYKANEASFSLQFLIY